MFIIEIKRQYKYNYIITKNKTELIRFNTKKQARDYLYQLSRFFRQIDREQSLFSYSPFLLQNGDTLALYTEIRPTLGDSFRYETKDYFRIERITNN